MLAYEKFNMLSIKTPADVSATYDVKSLILFNLDNKKRQIYVNT